MGPPDAQQRVRPPGAQRRRQLEQARRDRLGGHPGPISLGRDPLGIGQAEDPGGLGLHRPNRRLLYLLAGALVVLVLLRALGSHGGRAAAAPPLARSCTQAAFAAAPTTVSTGMSIQLALTGPAGNSYAIYLDVTAVDGSGLAAVRTPTAGVPAAQTQLLAAVRGLPACYARREVALEAPVRAGEHVLTLLQVGPGPRQTLLATIPLTVS